MVREGSWHLGFERSVSEQEASLAVHGELVDGSKPSGGEYGRRSQQQSDDSEEGDEYPRCAGVPDAGFGRGSAVPGAIPDAGERPGEHDTSRPDPENEDGGPVHDERITLVV